MRDMAPGIVLMVASLTLATQATAAPITFEFEGSVSFTSTALSGAVSSGDIIIGSYTFDSGTAGVFTPAANPTFLRDELLFSNPVTSVSLTINGQTASGTGSSSIILNDSAGSLAGDDDYTMTATLDTGAIGGIAPVDVTVYAGYPFSTFDLDASSTLPLTLPPLAGATFTSLSINLENGNFINANLDRLENVSAIPVPAAIWLFAAGLGALAAAGRIRRPINT